MAQFVIMPRQGQSVESCIITSWSKKVGDRISKGDNLFSYETDKSTFDEVSEFDGTLLEILFEEGDDVPCLETVCVIGDAGEDISGANLGGRRKISPRAKALALKTNADILKALPTGPNGRIIERDIDKVLDEGFTVPPATLEAYLLEGVSAESAWESDHHIAEKTPEASVTESNAVDMPMPVTDNDKSENVRGTLNVRRTFGDYTEVKMTRIRQTIAKAMHNSLSETAQLTLNASFDATAILEFRAALKAKGEALGFQNITINDMILYAVSRALLNHRDINANLVDGNMRYFSHANIGIAADTERGLIVPVLFGADTMSLNSLSLNAKSLINGAKSGSIDPDLLKGGTFTVTNLGVLGIESFTPVINPPQTAILGVCCVTQRLREGGAVYPAMGLSLTFDHRAVDGAPAARFLSDVCVSLENFNLLLAK